MLIRVILRTAGQWLQGGPQDEEDKGQHGKQGSGDRGVCRFLLAAGLTAGVTGVGPAEPELA